MNTEKLKRMDLMLRLVLSGENRTTMTRFFDKRKDIIIHGKTESSMSGDIRYRRHKLKTKIRRLNFYIKTH